MPLEVETEEKSLRDEISSAFDAVEEKEGVPVPPETPEAPAPETVAPPETPETPPETPEKGRDERGRFTKAEEPKEKAQEPAKAPEKAPPAQVKVPAAPAPQEPAKAPEKALAAPDRAPSSWRPAAREKWASLPAEVKAEAIRLDKEVRGVLQETAQARRSAEQWQQTVGPHEQRIREAGGDLHKEVAGLLHTSMVLERAPMHVKAQVVANIIAAALPGREGYEALDQALSAKLSGQPMPPGPGAGASPMMDPRMIAQMVKQEVWGDLEKRAQERDMAAATARVEAFKNDPQYEFYEDIKYDIADLMELYGKRGIELSMADAYNLAVKMNPEIETVVSQRKAAEAVRTAKAATQRVRAASSSVRSTPATGPKGGQQQEDQSLRDDISQAFDKYEQGESR